MLGLFYVLSLSLSLSLCACVCACVRVCVCVQTLQARREIACISAILTQHEAMDEVHHSQMDPRWAERITTVAQLCPLSNITLAIKLMLKDLINPFTASRVSFFFFFSFLHFGAVSKNTHEKRLS